MMVVTCTQGMRQLQEESTTRSKEHESGAKPHEISEVPEDSACIGSKYDSEKFSSPQEKAHKTRQQKRELRKQYHEASKQDLASELLGVSTAKLKELQQTDVTLSKVCLTANNDDAPSTDKPYYWQSNLLYRHWRPHGGAVDAVVNQLVLPQKCREKVLAWFMVFPWQDTWQREDKEENHATFLLVYPLQGCRAFCQCCKQCQKSSNEGIPKAPLVPLPIVSTSFEKIAIDIVGPLPRSRNGHRYILMICDHTTQYPEAIPLRSINAERIAEELIKVFARVGIPNEILTDRGSNFTFKLLAELY